MATPTGYTNPLLAAVYERYGIMDDTAATTDKNALAAYTALEKELAKYRSGGINAQVLKQWSDGLKAETAALSSTQRLIAAFNETAAKSDRVQTQAVTDLVRNVADNTTRSATQSAQTMSLRAQPALAAYEGAGRNIATGMEKLLQTLTSQGVVPSLENPDIAGIGQVIATQMFGKPLSELTADEAASMVGDNQYLQEQTRKLIQHAKNAYFSQAAATENSNAIMDKLYDLTATSGGVLTGAQRRDALHLVDQLGALMEAQVGKSATEMREEMERVASLDSTYRKLEQDTEEMRALAIQPGQEGLRSKIGRVVATDEFRAWAEDNGFNIGQAQIDANGEVIYVPGQDDERALLAYGRQMKTGAPVRLFGTQNTGKRVRVTATDPEERARLLQQNDLGGGQYAVLDGTVVSPAMYRRELRGSGLIDNGVEQAFVNGVTYVKNGNTVLKYADGKFVPLAEGEAAPTGFQPAMVYVDGKGRYMTVADIDNPPKDPNDIGFVTADDKREIEASSPYKIVTADQLPSLGEVTFDGYLDKANAQLIAKHGTGALSVNNGQHVFTKGAKVEVLETRGAGEPLTTSLERRAKRREAGAEFKALTPEQVRTAAAQERKTAPAAAPVGVSDIAARAAADEAGFGPARVETLVEGGIISPREGAAALEGAEGAPALVSVTETKARPQFADDVGYTFEVVDDNTIMVVGAPEGVPMPRKTLFKRGDAEFNDVVKNLKAASRPLAVEAAAPAAPAAPKARYAETPDGAQYRIDREGVTMVAPPRGETMPAQSKTMPFGSDEADAITERSDLRVLPPAAAQAIETRMAGLGKEAVPPEAEVTERRGSTFIDRGVRRTVGGDIREALAKAGEAVGGVFKRRPPMAEGEMVPPGEAAPPVRAAEVAPAALPRQRREAAKRQEAIVAALPSEAAIEALPERGPITGTGEPPKVGSVAGALDIGRGRQAMGLLERGTTERDADLRAKVAAIKAKEAAKPGSALEEVAALGQEFRERLKRPAGKAFTPVGMSMPRGESELQKRRAFARVGGDVEAEEAALASTAPGGLSAFRRYQQAAVKR